MAARLPLAPAMLLALASCVAPARPDPVPAMPAPAAPFRPAAAPAPPPAPAARDIRLVSGTPEQGGFVVAEAPPGTTAVTVDGRPVPVAPDRRFLVGFDRDAAEQVELVALAPWGEARLPIAVARRDWRIERVDVPYRAGATSAEFARRRPAELQRIAGARAALSESDGWRQAFRWPATGRISGLFGAQRVYQGKPGSYHSGTDVAVPTGTPVLSPADGVVVLATAAPFTLEGNLVLLDHGMGLNSAFLHLSRIDVAEGQRVAQGERIGAAGATGRATGPHLHWGLRLGDARLDPLLVTGPMPGR